VLGLSTAIEVERLFAEYCLAGACRGLDKKLLRTPDGGREESVRPALEVKGRFSRDARRSLIAARLARGCF
jgi:hypothetical protein